MPARSLVHYLFLLLQFCVLGSVLPAQSGGSFDITRSVIANGGGASSGGPFELSGTSGQAIVNNSTAPPYAIRGGFWQGNLGPTAALVSLSGRVTTAYCNGIRNVIVSLAGTDGRNRRALTGAFGYYRFDDVEVGNTVVITIAAKRYTFANPTRIVSVVEDIASVDFTAEP